MSLYKYNNKELLFEKTNKLLKYRFIVGFLIICFGVTLISAIKKPKVEYVKTEITIKEQDCKKTVFEMIDELPFKYPEIVKAQALIESGNFKSVLFKTNQNAFGMRQPMQRLSTATGSNLNHATYKTIEDCVIDRLLYETKYLHGLSRLEYLRYLDATYAEIGGYDKLLEKVIRQNKL